MKVFINSETKEIPAGFNVNKLLEHFSLPTKLIAIELNREVVRRIDWEDVKISESDKIEIIHFVGGG